MSFTFSKYSGCGNDFILVDNRKNCLAAFSPTLIQKICARCTGIGADGLILLENSERSDFRMRIFNADGFEAEMCGNGIRCLMKFIQECGYDKSHCLIETFLRPLAVSIDEDLITVDMGNPFDFRWNLSLLVTGTHYAVHHINTGVPHLIHFTDELEQFNLAHLGPLFRHHEQFSPQGANVNIAQLGPDGVLWNRTFERGVEQETLACGTGCAAVAIAASKILGIHSPIKVRTSSHEILEFSFTNKNDQITDLKMTGPAVKIFSGKWEREII